ncbi:hypothetical protein D3C76_1139070 [compost metagenome]
MIRTKRQGRFHVHHRITRQHAAVHGFTQTFFHRWNVFARHHAAFGGIFKLKAAARFKRFQAQDHVAILPFTAGLAHKFAFDLFHRFAQRLAVGHLRATYIGFDAKLTLHTVDDNFASEITGSGNSMRSSVIT